MYEIPPSQIAEINKLLLEYSKGNYEFQGKISKNQDEVDTIIMGVNMLGEELQYTTINRDYFLCIFNSITNLVLIVNKKGVIQDINIQAKIFCKDFEDNERKLNDIVDHHSLSDVWKYIQTVLKKNSTLSMEVYFQCPELGKVPFRMKAAPIKLKNRDENEYIIVAEDITEEKEMQRLILRASLNAQLKEQRRIAQDLHDALGQELSALSMMLSNLKPFLVKDNDKAGNLYSTCTDVLYSTIQNLREISFNIMPMSLQRGSLKDAVVQLSGRLKNIENIKVDLKFCGSSNNLDKLLQLTLYRIIQEFVNNSIKHSKCSIIRIVIESYNNKIYMELSDNGVGFDINEMTETGFGQGLNNFQTRLRAFNGQAILKSKLNEGTLLNIEVPLNKI